MTETFPRGSGLALDLQNLKPKISIKGAELENNTFSQVLDEINLAPSDLLQRIQGLIERSYLPWVLQLGFVHGFSAPFVWSSGELVKGVGFKQHDVFIWYQGQEHT